jgi:8-oxo-dGTP pyrophosphatase MutT (NUDIX family)
LGSSARGRDLNKTHFPDFTLRLKEVISARPKVHIEDKSRKPAAVLIPLYYRAGMHYIVLTRRTELVSYHKGEISFPGGGVHQSDRSLKETALRESQEEIGLRPDDVNVLGELDDMLTKGSNFVVTPFVGSIQPGYKFTASSFETAEILEIPVPALLREGCRREEAEIVLGGQAVCQYIYSYQGAEIIGATARILKQFLDIYSLIQPL